MTTWYYLKTEYACGAIVTDEKGVVVDAAPIFRKLKGQRLDSLPKRWNLHKLGEVDSK